MKFAATIISTVALFVSSAEAVELGAEAQFSLANFMDSGMAFKVFNDRSPNLPTQLT